MALDDVSAEFHSGEIHAVLGENGAGKSTLMNVLGGFLRPDAGEVGLDGASLPLGQAALVRRRGVEMVHQHFMLVPAFTVQENFALAALPGLKGRLDAGELAAPAQATAERLGWSFDPGTRMSDLSVGAQQRVEIVKALATGAPVLILDEPTAVLTPEEVEELFEVLRRVRDEGRIVILIAHKLREVLSVADRVTVLRRGRRIASAPAAQTDAAQLSEWMVGELPPARSVERAVAGAVGLAARDLVVRGDRGEPAVNGVSLEIRAGEVLGVGGVDGNGQTELAESLAGVRRPDAGEIAFGGRAYRLGLPRLAYVPQDRQGEGLALGLDVEENLLVTAGGERELYRGAWLRPRAARGWAEGLMRRFDVRASGVRTRVGTLSGGNQQKIVVARALARTPELLVCVNPTRGLDFRATEFVHTALREAAGAGAAVALFSSDRDELAALSDRQIALSSGQVAP